MLFVYWSMQFCAPQKFRSVFCPSIYFLKFRPMDERLLWNRSQWSCFQLIIFRILPDHFNAIQIKILILDHIQSCRTHFVSCP